MEHSIKSCMRFYPLTAVAQTPVNGKKIICAI